MITDSDKTNISCHFHSILEALEIDSDSIEGYIDALQASMEFAANEYSYTVVGVRDNPEAAYSYGKEWAEQYQIPFTNIVKGYDVELEKMELEHEQEYQLTNQFGQGYSVYINDHGDLDYIPCGG